MLIQRGFQHIEASQILIYLSVEGEKRERLYFNAVAELLDSNEGRRFRLEVDAESGKSSPGQVIDRAKIFLQLHSYADPNRMWLVTDADVGYLEAMEKRRGEVESLGFRFGISNPCFELWLRLHERDPDDALTDAKSYKNANTFDLNAWRKEPKPDWIRNAVRRAELLPGSATKPFPQNPGTQLGELFRYLGFG